MAWKCPNCGSKSLSVTVTTEARLIQYGGNFETEVEGDHEWDGESLMTCLDCSYCSASHQFDQGISEEQALARILRHLAKLGWTPEEVYDEDDPIYLVDLPVDEVVAECRAFDDCHLRVGKDGEFGTIYLVWGNSPMELVADHTTRWGLDEAIDAALASVWPLYPDDSEIAEEAI